MESDLIAPALARAAKTLQQTPQPAIQKLSLADCSLIIDALPSRAEFTHIRIQLAQRLQKQLSQNWIQTGNLHEVFAVLTALWQYDPALIGGEHLASAVQRLVLSEVAVGGPYAANGTPDIATNAHIANFMRVAARPLPLVDAYLAAATEANPTDDGRLLYILAQAHVSKNMAAYARQNVHRPHWQTPARLAASLLILSGELSSTEAANIITTLCNQQRNGLWADTTHSPLITTVIVIAALEVYRAEAAPRYSLQRQAIIDAAKISFAEYGEPLRSSALAMIDKMHAADTNCEITLLPHFFAQSLKKRTRPDKTLCLASLYGWIAYTIYDDFLDGEGQPALLPVANIAMRNSLHCFGLAVPDDLDFIRYATSVFAAMDEANAWELQHCRFIVAHSTITIASLPTYDQGTLLATRALAHSLAPMAVLAQQQLLDATTRELVELAFRHYLIARQLGDDLHDWLKDAQAGHASYVVTAILHDMHIQPGTYTVMALVTDMRRCFRHTTMPNICRDMLQHIGESRRLFVKTDLFKATNAVYDLLDTLESNTLQALDRHKKAQGFSAIQLLPTVSARSGVSGGKPGS